jgi:hypothetical protein
VTGRIRRGYLVDPRTAVCAAATGTRGSHANLSAPFQNCL